MLMSLFQGGLCAAHGFYELVLEPLSGFPRNARVPHQCQGGSIGLRLSYQIYRPEPSGQRQATVLYQRLCMHVGLVATGAALPVTQAAC